MGRELLTLWRELPTGCGQTRATSGLSLARLVVGMWEEIGMALARLGLAAALGTSLALRPKRRGTPLRTTAVVQTQIILALVGAVIMLVVGSSVARAFGIVG